MGIVASEIEVNVDPSFVFEIAKEVERYPDFMPDVKDVKVIERRDDGYSRVSWVGHVRIASIDKLIKWTEDEWWDAENLTSRFELIKGDYKHYRGNWIFTPLEKGVRIKLTIDFDLGLPLIGPMIVKLLDRVMQNNIDGMLMAIKKRAENEGA